MNDEREGPAVVILSSSSMAVAVEIKALTGGEIHGLSRRIINADVLFDDAGLHLGQLFAEKRMIIGVMACGALIRLLAPHIDSKHTDPQVLAVADDGSSVVPLLGGHHGGNQIARVIATHLGGHAAVTTAGDLRYGVALDEPPLGWTLANPMAAKNVMAGLLEGKRLTLNEIGYPKPEWLHRSELDFVSEGELQLSLTTQSKDVDSSTDKVLFYIPRIHTIGVGCERGTPVAEVDALIQQALETSGIHPKSVAGLYSLDLKSDETAIQEASQNLFGRAPHFFDAATLEAETSRLQNPSEIVFAEVGCHGVSEGAALAASGPDGELILPKIKSKRVTVAIARSPSVLMEGSVGSARGHLSVVGIGPGGDGWRSPEVSDLIGASTDLVGYSLYLDLLGGLVDGKARHDFDLGKEEDRVRHAMELAGQGRNVSLVCSGDAGIYAMATLVYELLDNGGLSDAAKRIAIQVSPGISALQGAAARAGAPLGHDFCTISLSDLLTPWEAIQMRVKAAAEGDFVIAFYNPVSKRRRTQLAYARDVLLQHRPADTPVILATNLGREGELIRVVPLAELNIEEVDMLTVVVVGSSDSRTTKTGDGKTWVYTPRGYAAKQGTLIGSEA